MTHGQKKEKCFSLNFGDRLESELQILRYYTFNSCSLAQVRYRLVLTTSYKRKDFIKLYFSMVDQKSVIIYEDLFRLIWAACI